MVKSSPLKSVPFAYILQKYPYLTGTGWNIQNEDLYGKEGFNYGKKTELFSCQAMSPEHIFSFEGIGVFPAAKSDKWWLLGFLNSSFVANYLNLTCGLHKNPVYLEKVPVPPFTLEDKERLSEITEQVTFRVLKRHMQVDMASPEAYQFEPSDHLSIELLLKEFNESADALGNSVDRSIEVIDEIVSKYISCEILTKIKRPPSQYPHLSVHDYLMALARKLFEGNSSQDVAFSGVLVDDLGHPADFYNALHEQHLRHWSCHEIAREEQSLLAVFERSVIKTQLFSAHIKQFTAARRKAPIYWQFATPSASYSIWCYYHRMTRDTFFRVANDYVAPKVDHEERKLIVLRQEVGPDPLSNQRKAIYAQETFIAELRAFLSEVKRIEPLWNPNLNDGVIINFSPLWRLVPQHKEWQKECKKVWDKLVRGDYDWSHLAMHLWPERVVPKCRDDRSLAIAHEIECEFWYEDDNDKWQKLQVSNERIEELIADRSSTAVKAALKDLIDAPAPSFTQNRRKRKAKV